MSERRVLGPKSRSVVTAAPVAVGPGVIGPMPPNAFLVYAADPRCEGRGSIIPDLVLCTAMRDKAAEYLVREVSAGRVRPGPDFRACTFPSDPNWANCIEFAVRAALPEIRFGVSPVWVEGSIGGVTYNGPAAGVAYPEYIRVSLADQSRIYRLCAWETANSLLANLLDKWADADGPITAAATDFAAAQCGVN